MKTKLFILGAILAGGLAQATTITGSGGTTGAQFVTSTGVFLTPTNATVQVGTFNTTTNLFTQFAATDTSPISFGTSAALTGRWLNSFGDNSGTAAAFNGQQIWVKISVDLGGGVTGTGYFGSTLNFPTNGGGVGDGLSLPGSSLTTFDEDASRTGTAAFIAPGGGFTNGRVTIGVVPEPSTALLGLLGVAGLIRRRR
jgi:hypothetical protein